MNHFFLIVCDSYVSLFMNKCNWSTYFTNENWNCTDADAVCLIECGRVDVNKTEAVKPDGWIDGDCAIKKKEQKSKKMKCEQICMRSTRVSFNLSNSLKHFPLFFHCDCHFRSACINPVSKFVSVFIQRLILNAFACAAIMFDHWVRSVVFGFFRRLKFKLHFYLLRFRFFLGLKIK